jgi:hypothetical protein
LRQSTMRHTKHQDESHTPDYPAKQSLLIHEISPKVCSHWLAHSFPEIWLDQTKKTKHPPHDR